MDDDIRKADNSYFDCLINEEENNENINIPVENDELKTVLEMSRKEYNEMYFKNDINDMNYENYDDILEKTIKISNESYIEKIYNDINKKENRIKSLDNFTKRIKLLTYTENDKKLKKYIEHVLNQYFELNIDFINVDKEYSKELYELIDSYYKIPFEKGLKRTVISKEEDEILRTIFLA